MTDRCLRCENWIERALAIREERALAIREGRGWFGVLPEVGRLLDDICREDGLMAPLVPLEPGDDLTRVVLARSLEREREAMT